MQHDMLRRFNRYGVTEETLWRQYVTAVHNRALGREEFGDRVRRLAQESQVVARSSLYVHLLDQLQWNLLQPDEIVTMADELLDGVAEQYGVDAPHTGSGSLGECLAAWSTLVVRCVLVQTQVASLRAVQRARS